MSTVTAVRPRPNLWLPDLATIGTVKAEIPGTQTYELIFDDPQLAADYRFLPGQFNMLYVPTVGEAAISISSDPEEPSRLGHTIRAAGNVTQAFTRLRPGDQVGVRGPFGSSWPMDACQGQDVILACGGIGLAPLRPAIYHIIRHRSDYGRVILLYGARTPRDLLFADEYESWRQKNVEVELTVDVGSADWPGNVGVVPVLFYRLRLNAARTRLLTCGPEIMMRFVIFEALARRLKPEHIYLTMERNMKCAVGLCGHCQLGPAFVCKDGPVFTYRQMEPYIHVEDL
jgi:NAD(P)H-flavin reductase